VRRGLTAFGAALALATPATAQDRPAWVGVWQGTVGRSPVRLCIDVWGDGPARGSYYYLSQLEPIALSEEDGEGGWIERAPADETEASWNFAEQSATALRGQWRRLRVTHPFDLRPVPWTEGEWGGPCSSDAFLAPRVHPAEIADEPAAKDGWAHTRRLYRPPAHFAGEVMIESFAFEAREPGDAAINAALAAYLPQGAPGDEFVQCLAGAIASLGTDGYFERTVRPGLVSAAFLGVDEANSDYCGGAHPNHWTVSRTFDRRTGEEIDLFDWIGEARIDGEDAVIADGLRALVLARWPADSGDCRASAEDAQFWSLGLAREGLAFTPDLPHVATACEETVTLDWAALEPFLDAEGRAGVARLRAR
jgi:hypothetical protein